MVDCYLWWCCLLIMRLTTVWQSHRKVLLQLLLKAILRIQRIDIHSFAFRFFRDTRTSSVFNWKALKNGCLWLKFTSCFLSFCMLFMNYQFQRHVSSEQRNFFSIFNFWQDEVTVGEGRAWPAQKVYAKGRGKF